MTYADRYRKDDPDRKFLMSREWRERLRPAILEQQPLCVFCEKLGRLKAATQIDHIIRPRGDPVLQRDAANMQPLCNEHHRIKSNWERTGGDQPLMLGCGVDGWPVTWKPGGGSTES